MFIRTKSHQGFTGFEARKLASPDRIQPETRPPSKGLSVLVMAFLLGALSPFGPASAQEASGEDTPSSQPTEPPPASQPQASTLPSSAPASAPASMPASAPASAPVASPAITTAPPASS